MLKRLNIIQWNDILNIINYEQYFSFDKNQIVSPELFSKWFLLSFHLEDLVKVLSKAHIIETLAEFFGKLFFEKFFIYY